MHIVAHFAHRLQPCAGDGAPIPRLRLFASYTVMAVRRLGQRLETQLRGHFLSLALVCCMFHIQKP